MHYVERKFYQIVSSECSIRTGSPYVCTTRKHGDLRKFLNIRWPEVISNEELWERRRQSRIEESINMRKWKCIRNTLRKPENNITHPSNGTFRGPCRRRGFPRKSWRRSVLDKLAKKNITCREVKRAAKNRVRWREVHGL